MDLRLAKKKGTSIKTLQIGTKYIHTSKEILLQRKNSISVMKL
jgi:hypothetical protein